MEANLNKWNSIEEIRNSYDRFVQNLKKIGDLQPELDQDFTPIREEVSLRRQNLLEKLSPAGNILEVFTRDHDPGKKVRAMASDWRRAESLGNHRLLDLSAGIHDFMEEHLPPEGTEIHGPPGGGPAVATHADLRRYGMNETLLKAVQASIREYRYALGQLDEVLGRMKKTRKKRDGLIRNNRKILKNRLDKLMSVFSGTHPSFYLEYSTLRTQKPAD